MRLCKQCGSSMGVVKLCNIYIHINLDIFRIRYISNFLICAQHRI